MSTTQSSSQTASPLSDVKALLTDVFGTVVDWRRTVTKTLEASARSALDDGNNNKSSLTQSLRKSATQVDWAAFAQSWRMAYYAFTRTYDPAAHEGKPNSNDGGKGFVTIDRFFRSSLEDLTCEYGVEGLWSSEELDRIARCWHVLEPWPDSAEGIALISGKSEEELGLQIATLSNGNTQLLTDLAKFGGLKYTSILSAQDFGAYKPNPKVYLGAAKMLGLKVEECAMVAAHLADLWAARSHGLRTIYVGREGEDGEDRLNFKNAKEEGWVDMWIGKDEAGLLEVAKRLKDINERR